MLTAMKRFRRLGVRQQTSLCADANRRLRPNPRLHPALLRLSAMVSQYFIALGSY